MSSCKGCGHHFRGIDYHHKSIDNGNGLKFGDVICDSKHHDESIRRIK